MSWKVWDLKNRVIWFANTHWLLCIESILSTNQINRFFRPLTSKFYGIREYNLRLKRHTVLCFWKLIFPYFNLWNITKYRYCITHCIKPLYETTNLNFVFKFSLINFTTVISNNCFFNMNFYRNKFWDLYNNLGQYKIGTQNFSHDGKFFWEILKLWRQVWN